MPPHSTHQPRIHFQPRPGTFSLDQIQQWESVLLWIDRHQGLPAEHIARLLFRQSSRGSRSLKQATDGANEQSLSKLKIEGIIKVATYYIRNPKNPMLRSRVDGLVLTADG